MITPGTWVPPLLMPCHHLRATSGAALAPDTWERGISRWLLSAHSRSIPSTWMLRVSSASSTSATAVLLSPTGKGRDVLSPAAMMTPSYLRRIASVGLIHRSAWKRRSANFALTAFSEVAQDLVTPLILTLLRNTVGLTSPTPG